jgi:ketosteroid isomerase-like protein
MKCALALATLFFVSLWLAATTSSVVEAQSEEAEVRAAETARTNALVHADVTALEKFMADDVTYVHASGKSDTKSSYLEAIRSGQLRYLLWEPHQMNVRVLGETAVLNGMYSVRAIDLRVQKDPLNLDVFFLTVYAHRDGRWQQIAWQTTRAPATPK